MNTNIHKYLREIGSRGGKSKSVGKAEAARKNGKLGGRPKKCKP